MKKNGFTLIELIAVIVVLAVLLTFVSISAINIMNKSKKDLGEFTIDQVKDAAKTYALDNDCELPYGCTLGNNDSYENKISELYSYYPEMEEKCSFNNNSYIEIIENNSDENDGDIDVDIKNITCEG